MPTGHSMRAEAIGRAVYHMQQNNEEGNGKGFGQTCSCAALSVIGSAPGKCIGSTPSPLPAQ